MTMSGPEIERQAAELVKLLRSKAPLRFVDVGRNVVGKHGGMPPALKGLLSGRP